MAEAAAPAVFTIPPHRAFADALAAGLLARAGGDRMRLARGLILLPTNRAVRAVTDAFVRRAEGGLLLPRLAVLGDPAMDERLGSLFDPLGDHAPIPPAVAPMERQMILARLIGRADPSAEPAQAIRLAADLGRTLDQLITEKVAPALLADAVPAELSDHWQVSLSLLRVVLEQWPAILAARGMIDLAERRNRLIERVAAAWEAVAPDGPVVAAGITSAAPSSGRLLRIVARMEQGGVVFPGLDLAMPQEEWDALGPHEPDAETGIRRRPIEVHPQYQLKRILDRMGVGRHEVRRWRWGGGRDARAVRTRAIGHAMAPAAFTGRWQRLPPIERRMSGVRAMEFANPAEEAQAIAIAMRQAIETPGRTAALVTPDRTLARRVATHLGRWGVRVDDSAGTPLSATPPGTLLIGMAEAMAERFAPVALLALLKHPLVNGGGDRLGWLEGARLLDRALRGPRPAPGLAGVSAHLAALGAAGERAAIWWAGGLPQLAPLEDAQGVDLPTLIALLRDGVERLAGDAAWAGPAGRSAAEWLSEVEATAGEGPKRLDAATLPHVLRALMETVAVRPPAGGHPRLFIWGLIEARLQHADLMILGGLNEGVWPAAPSPDPWLAPRIRADLGLPGLDARIGSMAHDFAMGVGARDVLLTRARRDARAPTVASRFWLRLEAMTGGLARAHQLRRWAGAIDHPAAVTPARRPAPRPPVTDRPRRIAVTKLDRLKADPFAFYADAMLRLRRLDPPDADPSPAWRGSAVHRVFEAWMIEDACDPARLVDRGRALMAEMAAHPVLRALWSPRLIEAMGRLGEQVAADLDRGRRPIAAERTGTATIGAIELYGTVDRIDRLADGTLGIVDYKTGKAPSSDAVRAGFAMQLGLLGLIAEHGGFEGIEGAPAAFEYWSLATKNGARGYRDSAVKGDDVAGFTNRAAQILAEAAARWLTGDEPFIARLHPKYAPYGDYDQLMRLDEWYGLTGA